MIFLFIPREGSVASDIRSLDEFRAADELSESEHTTMQCKRIKRTNPRFNQFFILLLPGTFKPSIPVLDYLAKIGLLMFKNRIASNRSLSPFTVMFALRNCRVKRSIVYCGQRGTANTRQAVSDEDQ